MICTFLRVVQYTEKLHRSAGKRWFLPPFVLNKACLKTEPLLRWGLHEQSRTVRPRRILGVIQKTIWTQGQSPQRAKEDSSKQVSVHSQRGETAISMSQKGKREFSRDGHSFSKRGKSGQCPFIEVQCLRWEDSSHKLKGRIAEQLRIGEYRSTIFLHLN